MKRVLGKTMSTVVICLLASFAILSLAPVVSADDIYPDSRVLRADDYPWNDGPGNANRVGAAEVNLKAIWEVIEIIYGPQWLVESELDETGESDRQELDEAQKLRTIE